MSNHHVTGAGAKWLLPAIVFVVLLACVGIGLSLYSVKSDSGTRRGKESTPNQLVFEGHKIEGEVHELADAFKTENVTVFSEGDNYVNLNGFSFYGYDNCALAVRGTPRSHTAYTIEVTLPYTDDFSLLKERFFWFREQFLKKYHADNPSDHIDVNMEVLASVNSLSDLYWKQLGIGQAGQTPETKITNFDNGEIRIIIWCKMDRATIIIFYNNLRNEELRQQEINKNKEEGKGDWLDNL